MKTLRNYIVIVVLSLFFAHECYSQPHKYRGGIRPKVKHSLDSLYPYAKPIHFEAYPSDTAQLLTLWCNCPEINGMIVLLFDTNGHVLNKEIRYDDSKNLPDTIRAYIKKNTSKDVGFYNNYMSKSINNKNEIIYGIMMWKITYYGKNPIIDEFLLKFDSLGNFLSKEKLPKLLM